MYPPPLLLPPATFVYDDTGFVLFQKECKHDSQMYLANLLYIWIISAECSVSVSVSVSWRWTHVTGSAAVTQQEVRTNAQLKVYSISLKLLLQDRCFDCKQRCVILLECFNAIMSGQHKCAAFFYLRCIDLLCAENRGMRDCSRAQFKAA